MRYSAAEMIRELDAMQKGTDKELAHCRADHLITEWMARHDPAARRVALAWRAARERVGFWYA